MEDRALKTLDGFTIEEWREKYKLADTARMDNARIAGDRLQQIRDWSAIAQFICTSCGIEWPIDVCFDSVVIEYVKELKKRNLDLSGDVGKLSAINVVALDLLKRFVETSREPSENECVYCNCEDPQGHYDGCIMIEVRKLLTAAEQGHEADVPSFAEYEHHIDN